MAQEVGSIYFDLDADTSKFHSALNSAEAKAHSAGKGMSTGIGQIGAGVMIGNLATQGLSMAWQGLQDLVGSSLTEFKEGENAMAQLETVIKSTGGAAGLSAKDIKEQAQALSQMTGYADDAVMSGANLLLTFTNIKGPIMQEAIGTTLDMSTALGQDLKSSSIQLGKALNDPINGITALRRVGVNFTDQQKEQIEAMVKSGDTMGAQKVILKELNTEFGGSAVAAGKTFEGQMKRTTEKVNALKENIGKMISDGIKPLVSNFNDWIDKAGGVDGITQKLKDTMKVLGDIIGGVIGYLKKVWDILAPFVIPIFQWFVQVIKDLINQVTTFYKQNKEWLEPVLIAIGVAVAAVVAVFIIMNSSIVAIGLVIWVVIQAFIIFVDWIKSCIKSITNFVNDVNKFFKPLGDFFGGVFKSIDDMFIKPFKSGIDAIVGGVKEALKFLGLYKEEAKTAKEPKMVTQKLKDGSTVTTAKFATGTSNFIGGMALVGERGPELLNLPSGSQIIPNHQLDSIGGSKNEFYGNIYLQDKSAVDEFFTRLNRNQELSNKGMAII